MTKKQLLISIGLFVPGLILTCIIMLKTDSIIGVIFCAPALLYSFSLIIDEQNERNEYWKKREEEEQNNRALHRKILKEFCDNNEAVDIGHNICVTSSAFYYIFSDCIDPEKIGDSKYLFEDIAFYYKEGDEQYTTSISGGGGGGYSLSGAIIGGAIAGDVGAIVGSRNKIEPIHSEEIKKDNRKTVVCFKDDTKRDYISLGFELYNALFKKIPNKDLATIQSTNHLEQKSTELNAEERLNKIISLLNNGLISKEEYEAKRNEIISQI